MSVGRNAKDAGTLRLWRVGRYLRLSREDGDRVESESITGQDQLTQTFTAQREDLLDTRRYVDDGFTGTNFNRPSFQSMIADVKAGVIDCVVVKDLSRFGRDYIDVGWYLERWFPAHGVRFIAINDHIDSSTGSYNLILPVKNIFNEQYARDISEKVKTAVRTKQKNGAFVGAFPSYGYRKDPQNHNKLLLDPPAAEVVRRIFTMFEGGMGKLGIAKALNEEHIPCPSEYKRLNGERYYNGQRMGSTTYWTYATIHRMLQNEMYLGNMTQGRKQRQRMHGKAQPVEKKDWIVVPGTHEAIISKAQWERVQAILQKKTRTLSFQQNRSPFAGYLTCGDCGRAMVKTKNARGEMGYCCGSYKRYGAGICSKHGISHQVLEEIVLEDLNRILQSIPDVTQLIRQEENAKMERHSMTNSINRATASLHRIYRLKKAAYEDFREGFLSEADYIQYKEDYDGQEKRLQIQLETWQNQSKKETPVYAWRDRVLAHGKLMELDRITVAEVLEGIQIFEDQTVEITYRVSDSVKELLEPSSTG